MLNMINKKIRNNKGFTLIELIVVLAILGIIAAIAIPKFSGIQDSAKLKADTSTAAAITKAARLQETVTGLRVVEAGDTTDTNGTVNMSKEYFDLNADEDDFADTPQTNPDTSFDLTKDIATDRYCVTWVTDSGTYTYYEGDDEASYVAN